jgi:hypothetical protein
MITFDKDRQLQRTPKHDLRGRFFQTREFFATKPLYIDQQTIAK